MTGSSKDRLMTSDYRLTTDVTALATTSDYRLPIGAQRRSRTEGRDY